MAVDSSLYAEVCRDDELRRQQVLGRTDLNGIDYVEVDPADHTRLYVNFLNPLPAGEYGLVANPDRILITGGTRVVGIKVKSSGVTKVGARALRVEVDRGGDYSLYRLSVTGVAQLDARLATVPFSFMASCRVDFDCRPDTECPPELASEPALDYLAKDYGSFRRLLLDLLAQLNPDFVERNPADLGIALVELLAYTGDQLSYFQDVVANEAFLDSVRHRISARRHARLIDYKMHDGRNAWTAVHVVASGKGPLPQGSRLLTRITSPLRDDTQPPGTVIASASITPERLAADPALAGLAVFETTHPVALDPDLNEIQVHSWGNEQCCLRAGATEAYLYSVRGQGPNKRAVAPPVKPGDLLLLEEVRGADTGLPGDADITHRQVVRIDDVLDSPTSDPLYSRDLDAEGGLVPWQSGPKLPLQRVTWRRRDALTFPVCLSARTPAGRLLAGVSVARGNMVLADHGLTLTEALWPASPDPQALPAQTFGPPIPDRPPFRPALPHQPLTMQCQPFGTAPRFELGCDAREARPAISLDVYFDPGQAEPWRPVPDLLDSGAFEGDFVVEVDNDGATRLRFGDGDYGRRVEGAIRVLATYRIGNGRDGNVGAEAIAHVSVPGLMPNWIGAVRNPLPSTGGADAETIDEVRELAPQAFRARQFRAVTEADYAAAADELPEVAGAVATFRWTGSWYTALVGVDPADSADLVLDPRGTIRLSTGLESKVMAFLTRRRLAGYDLEIKSPVYAPLEVEIDVCVADGYFRSDVKKAVVRALEPGLHPDGSRGFFDPANFSFGQAVYLSQLYAAVMAIEGVASAEVRIFKRYGRLDSGELARGEIPMAPWEIAQLENDPSFMEHGVLRVNPFGGKG